MAEIIEMPKLSDTMTTGTLVKWLKNEGDKVASGDMICEVETDKATMEVENFFDGVLIKQYVSEGGQLPVGQPMCAIGEEGEEAPAGGASSSSKSESSKKESSAPAQEEKPAAKEEKEEASEAEPASSSDGERIKASPLAKKIAAEKGYDLAAIKGTGPSGRIVKADVLSHDGSKASASKSSSSSAPVAVSADSSLIGEDVDTPVSGMRGAIARRLLESKTTVPHFYLNTEVDAAPLGEIRKQLNAHYSELAPEKGGIKFTVNDLILKATAMALTKVPAVNSSWLGDKIRQYGSVHLSFGVAIDDGLVTPVIRDAQAKSLRQISLEAKSLIAKARNKKLTPDEMSGSTFTVTNLGMFDISNFYGIINPPNGAILSVGSTRKVPVFDKNDQVVPGYLMNIGLSGDHRVVDGANAAVFLKELKTLLETPSLMLV